MVKYRILSLDGGGIRGLLTTIVLERLTKEIPCWLDKTDLLAGTSTGGITALGLASGRTPTDMRNFYCQHGKQIFTQTLSSETTGLGKFISAKYRNDHLNKEFKDSLKDMTLSQLLKKVVIPSFDLDDNIDHDPTTRCWHPKIFHNFDGIDSDGHEKVADVALYTSAAPTYFPTVNGYIDGGIVANNPSMVALCQTQDIRAKIDPRPTLNEICLLSLGTGTSLSRIEGKNLNWGVLQWAHPMVHIMFDALAGIADYECKCILGDRYCRLAPIFPPNTTFHVDDVSKINQLIAFAENLDLHETIKWIKTQWI